MIKLEAVNTFHDGMIMDLNPLVTPNNVVTNALNATLITMNGNENSLLNDMGNGRVETAYLPEGYVPLGTALLGGIIYVVSYNPLSKKCLIGSFPSPERNITSDKFIENTNKVINCSSFYTEDDAVEGTGEGTKKYKFISNPYQKLILTDLIILHPGDKFQIYSPQINNETFDYISAFNLEDYNPDLLPKYLKFNVMAITDDGKMTNLNNTLVWLPLKEGDLYKGDYYIRNDKVDKDNYKDIDEYRNLTQSNYNVFQTKTSGKLGIIAELECIDSFDVAWDALKKDNNWEIYLYTNWTYKNDYAKDLINLFGVYCKSSEYKEEGKPIEKIIVINDYPTSAGKSNTDILEKNGVTFYNPDYIPDIKEYLLNENKGNSTEPRNNDGTDNQFLISTPIEVKTPSKTEKNAILDLSIMPLMPFGILLWLKLNISINLSKLGTGSIDLVLYRYYVEDETVLLNWGLEAYPERNKSINNVKFDFYEIDSSILTSIQNAGEKIDNNRICGNMWLEYSESEGWHDSEEGGLSLGNLVKSITNEGQSSYSGYFTEIFSREDLRDNYVYLVKISINYNEEKTIEYYRIFYNSNIFNDYYSSYKDFKEIPLDALISNLIQYTLKVKTLPTENSTKFNELVSPVSTEPYTEFLKYNISHKYKGRDIGILSATVNDVFTAEIDGINILNQTHELTNDALALLITSSSVTSSVTVDKITEVSSDNITYVKGIFSNNFEYGLTIPLLMTYNTKMLLNISYELTHATCTYEWMVYRGRDKYHHLSLYPNIKDIGTDSYYNARDSWGDDTLKKGTMSSTYTNCYNRLSYLLDIYDIIALPTMAVRGTGGTGNSSVSIGYNNNSNINSTKETSWTETLQKDSCGLFYAMKTLDGSVIVFSFDGIQGHKLFQTIGLINDIACLKAKSGDVYDITDNRSYDDGKIPEYIQPLRGYYIPVEYNGSVVRYLWTILEYYPSFLETSSHNIIGTSDIALFINLGVKLESGIKVKNLLYNNNKDLNISYSKSWDVPTSDLISTLTELGADVYVMMPDGTLNKNITVGRNNAYDYKGNKISAITNWKSGSEIPIISELEKSSKTLTLCVVNGRLRIKLNLIDSLNTGTILGKSEELKIYIEQIPIIPYVQ